MGVRLDGPAAFGWRDRTIGAQVERDGTRWWLRATGEHQDDTAGLAWTGNIDANAISGVPRPIVVERVAWEEPPAAIYAELMTLVEDAPCSPTPELRSTPALDDTWWLNLRTAVERLSRETTHRALGGSDDYKAQLSEFFGQVIPGPNAWATEHGDLHWANLTAPRLVVLDWEYWGRAPAGYGAASLYCHSLLVPEIAERVHDVFADLLDTRTGRYNQLAVVMYLRHRIGQGDYADLTEPLDRLAARLLAEPMSGR